MNTQVFEPMLAHEFESKKKKYVHYPVYIQPKLDGMRCISVESGLWSRTGKPIPSVPILAAQIKMFFPDIALDGELYGHHTSFETIMSSTRRTVNIQENTDVDYWVYDAFIPGSFATRWATLHNRFEHRVMVKARQAGYTPRIILVPTFLCSNEASVMNTFEKFIAEGFEGAMIRAIEAPYEAGRRSSYLLKLKKWKDVEGVVIDFEEGMGRNYGRLGALVCRLANGEIVKVGTGIEDAERERIWQNKEEYAERICTIKYQNTTAAGTLRFPSLLRWRKDE